MSFMRRVAHVNRGKVLHAHPRSWLLLRALLFGTLVGCADPAPRAPPDSNPSRPTDQATAFRDHLGRTWELTRLGMQEIPAPRTGIPSSGRDGRPTISFSADPAPEGSVHPAGTFRAGGRSFCNGYGTAYQLGPASELRFHGFESTLVGCDGPDSLETRFFHGLAETRRIELDSAKLVLIAEDGSRLTFSLAADSASQSRR